jgi:CheY-like chemotaxis protein
MESAYALNPDGRRRRVLIADDNGTNRQILVMMLKKAGFRTLTAKDGREAVEACRRLSPDLVLMDVNMPEMDGIQATRIIKMESGERFVPVVFVTALADQNSLANCLAAGGDDFISKPIDRVVLLARVESQLRVSDLYWEQYNQRTELAYFRDMVEREQQVAEKIFSRMMRTHTLNIPEVRYCLSPMCVFNGDLLLAAQTPNGKTHILVGDFTGHGLAASIGALPASDIFYGMTAEGHPLEEIVAEINERLNDLLPTGMFLGLCALEIDVPTGSLRVWLGGVPDLLIKRKFGSLQRLGAAHLPLGIVGSAELGLEMEALTMDAGDLLLAYTDGVIETENPNAEHYGAERLLRLVDEAGSGGDLFDKVLLDLEGFRAGKGQTDDFTLLQYQFPEGA